MFYDLSMYNWATICIRIFEDEILCIFIVFSWKIKIVYTFMNFVLNKFLLIYLKLYFSSFFKFRKWDQICLKFYVAVKNSRYKYTVSSLFYSFFSPFEIMVNKMMYVSDFYRISSYSSKKISNICHCSYKKN